MVRRKTAQELMWNELEVKHLDIRKGDTRYSASVAAEAFFIVKPGDEIRLLLDEVRTNFRKYDVELPALTVLHDSGNLDYDHFIKLTKSSKNNFSPKLFERQGILTTNKNSDHGSHSRTDLITIDVDSPGDLRKKGNNIHKITLNHAFASDDELNRFRIGGLTTYSNENVNRGNHWSEKGQPWEEKFVSNLASLIDLQFGNDDRFPFTGEEVRSHYETPLVFVDYAGASALTFLRRALKNKDERVKNLSGSAEKLLYPYDFSSVGHIALEAITQRLLGKTHYEVEKWLLGKKGYTTDRAKDLIGSGKMRRSIILKKKSANSFQKNKSWAIIQGVETQLYKEQYRFNGHGLAFAGTAYETPAIVFEHSNNFNTEINSRYALIFFSQGLPFVDYVEIQPGSRKQSLGSRELLSQFNLPSDLRYSSSRCCTFKGRFFGTNEEAHHTIEWPSEKALQNSVQLSQAYGGLRTVNDFKSTYWNHWNKHVKQHKGTAKR